MNLANDGSVNQMNWLNLSQLLVIILFARTALFAGGSSVLLWLTGLIKKYPIDARNPNKDSLLHDIFWAAFILIIDIACNVLAITQGWLVLSVNGSFLHFWFTFFGILIWSEIYFYYSHRFLHHPQLFWIHKHHHSTRPTTPWTSLAFSVPERLILILGVVVLPALLSQWIPFSQAGYSLYFLINYILNVYAHLNVEIIPHRWAKKLFGNIMNTTTYHALHHIRYNGHYGLYTQFLDRIHKTRFEDFWDVHKKNHP